MSWYKKVLKENKKEIVSSTLFAVVFGLTVLLWHFAFGKSFKWETISPISEPSFFNRAFYSALVFLTLGAFLYWIKLYQFLYYLAVRILDDKQLYRIIKGLIWGSLILIMYFWIVPEVVELMNTVLSFFYNILNIILYLFPPFGVSFIVFIVCYIIFRKYSFV